MIYIRPAIFDANRDLLDKLQEYTLNFAITFSSISISVLSLYYLNQLVIMFRKGVCFVFFFSLTGIIQAQNISIKGVLKNFETTASIQGATITLKSKSDTTNVRTGLSDTSGMFSFNSLQSDSFRLTITSVGFGPIAKDIILENSAIDLGILQLRRTADVLSGVTVTATVPMAVQKGDTVQINASQFKVNPDATAEDLARKMPGITIENGQVTAHGETVQKVTIDGRELFGDDATAALRNLPAEIVDKIQIFDRLSDQAQFTGIDDGSTTKGLNIITKANMRNGQFGRVFAGYGTDNRYQAGGNTTMMHENRKLSLVGNFNNINQQNFASQDLLGVTSSNSRRSGGGGSRGGGGGGSRGGGGGGNFQGGGNTGNFLVGQQNGINKTNAAGINYTDNWGSKVIVSGSYFFNNTNNNTNESDNRQYFLKGIPNYNQLSTNSSRNNNHRVSMRIEYRIDSANQLIITPALSFQNNSALGNVTTAFFDPTSSDITSRTTNTNSSNRSGNNLNNNLLYRHSFPKKGRTFSINLNTSSNSRSGDVYNSLNDTTFIGADAGDSASRRYTNQLSNGYNLAANIIYTEPLSKNSQLQLNYNPTYTKSKADQEAFEYEEASNKYSQFDPRLSSQFDNTYKAQNAGLAYRYGTRDNQLSFGLNYQRSDLHSDQNFPRDLTVDKTFNNILPNAMARFKLSSRSNIRFMYRANTSQPSVTQLQDVYDVTNLPFVTAGNPELVQQVMNVVSTRYTYNNASKGTLFVGNVFLQTGKNYITNATYVPLQDSAITTDIVLKSGQQLTKPVNLNGYLSVRSFLNFAFPIRVIKSNVNLNGGFTYSKLPGIINNVNNLSKSTTYTAGAVIASNVSQYVDFTISYSANISNVKNQLQASLNTNYFSHVAGVQLNLLSKAGWFFQNDVNNQLYSGLSAGYNQNYFLWNMSVGKKFLKNQKGELKLSVFDLLKQNRSITRNVTETYIEDVQNQVLQQYFMLTFTYNLRNFGALDMNNNRFQNRRPGPQF